MSKRGNKIELEEGSGNVFADLGLDDADELYARAQIGLCVYKILKAEKLKQREIAKVLAIPQPEVSHLMNGHFSRFTTDKLLEFLKRLNRTVTIKIAPHKPGEPYHIDGFGSPTGKSSAGPGVAWCTVAGAVVPEAATVFAGIAGAVVSGAPTPASTSSMSKVSESMRTSTPMRCRDSA